MKKLGAKLKIVKIHEALIDGKPGELLFDTPKIVLFVGKPKRGKSFALRHMILRQIMHHPKKQKFQFGVVWTRTAFSADYDWIAPEYVRPDWDPDEFIKYKNHLEGIKEKEGEIPPNFIVFDDLVSKVNWYSSDIDNFLCNHRHYNTSVFICAQYLLRGVSTTLREVTTYAILFNSKNKNTLMAVYENFGQLFENFNEFKAYFLNLTNEEFVGMLYMLDEDERELNYLSYLAPSKKPKVVITFSG